MRRASIGSSEYVSDTAEVNVVPDAGTDADVPNHEPLRQKKLDFWGGRCYTLIVNYTRR